MIKNNFPSTSFSLWKDNKNLSESQLENVLYNLGIKLDIETGHLFYTDHYMPVTINLDLVFVRHGETYGNCGQTTSIGTIDVELVKLGIKDNEKRIYQGAVDTEINQLTEYGKQQALSVSEVMRQEFLDKGWEPDVIFVSPLSRAIETALPFVQQNKFENRCFTHEGVKEMSFGSWDNQRVCDISSNDPCHLFYREQHALVKSSKIASIASSNEAENFCEVILRAYNVLIDMNEKYSGKKILIFSHSMFGGACCLLLGKGQKIDNGEYLAFDGKRMDGTYYTMPNATPFILQIKSPV